MEKQLERTTKNQSVENHQSEIDTPVTINTDNMNAGITVTNTGPAASFSTSGDDTSLSVFNSGNNLSIETNSPIKASGCLKDGGVADAFLHVKNFDSDTSNPGDKVSWAAYFESNSNTHSSLLVENTGISRGATILNTSSEHSTLVLENQDADGQGFRAATFTNDSSTHSTVCLTNKNSGPAIEVSNGGVKMIGSPTTGLKDGTYTANTDGFVIGVITPPDSASVTSVVWLTASSDDLTVRATGGNSSGPGISFTNYGNLLLPVQIGKEFSVSAAQGRNNDEDSIYSYYFIPMGTCDNPCTRESDSVPSSHMKKIQVEIGKNNSTDQLNDMINALEICFDKKLEGDKRMTLEKAFKGLLFSN